MFVAGWRHALRSEWPFIIVIIKTPKVHRASVLLRVSTVVAVCAALIGGGAVGAEAEITAAEHSSSFLRYRLRLVCTGEPPPKVCPCGDLTGSGRDLAWLSGVFTVLAFGPG